MRLLLVPDPTSPNGEDAFCREIAKRAPARGHEIHVQAIPNGPLDETLDRLTATGFALSSDFVLINSLQPAALLAARKAGKAAAVRLIDSYAAASPQAVQTVRELALKADLLLVPSQYLAGILHGWGANGQVRVIPYAYDRIMAQQIALVTVRATRPNGFPLVAVSALNEATRPGLETLFSAIARLRLDVHLSLIGVGPALPALQARAQQLLITGKVSFVGALPHEKIMEFFRAAKAYVDPCGVEGFPTLALHSLSEGCPVVAARTPPVTELIRHGENGLLFDAGDVLGLSEALMTLWSERGLSLRLIDEGIRTVTAMNWDATVDATLRALEGV